MNISCLLMAILEFTAVSWGRGAGFPSCLPLEPGNISGQIAKSRDTAHPLTLEGRRRCGEQSGLLFRTETCLL